MNQQNSANFIWSAADLLLGVFKRSEFGRVMLPFTLLRRLECVLEPTRDAVLDRAKALECTAIDPETALRRLVNCFRLRYPRLPMSDRLQIAGH